MIIHIPHAATAVPTQERRSFLLDDAALNAELLRMTDAFTDELFAMPATLATTIAYPVSRLLVDPERFEDDAAEPMSGRGMGVIYTRTSLGTPFRHAPETTERQRLLDTYYRPHHARLTDAVEASLQQHRRCLIIDAHSFASQPLPYEADQAPDRPDICMGTDDFHTPRRLTEKFVDAFRALGYSVAINRPYAGSLVPLLHYRRDSRVVSVMIEVNRSLYMDEQTGLKLTRFGTVMQHITSILAKLGDLHDANAPNEPTNDDRNG